MSDWVVLDITSITKSTNREKVLKVLKAGGMAVCKVTDPYMSNTRYRRLLASVCYHSTLIVCIRNRNTISVTVRRNDYETKFPNYPGRFSIFSFLLLSF